MTSHITYKYYLPNWVDEINMNKVIINKIIIKLFLPKFRRGVSFFSNCQSKIEQIT